MMVMVILLATFAGIIVGFLLGLRWCSADDGNCLEKEAEIAALVHELNAYKHWVNKVASKYKETHPDG